MIIMIVLSKVGDNNMYNGINAAIIIMLAISGFIIGFNICFNDISFLKNKYIEKLTVNSAAIVAIVAPKAPKNVIKIMFKIKLEQAPINKQIV